MWRREQSKDLFLVFAWAESENHNIIQNIHKVSVSHSFHIHKPHTSISPKIILKNRNNGTNFFIFFALSKQQCVNIEEKYMNKTQ